MRRHQVVDATRERRREHRTLLSVACVAAAAVVVYYLTHAIDLTPDSASYLDVAKRILDGGNPVDLERTPGYPLLLALGGGNLVAATILQGVLFVVSAVGVAFLAQRAVGRWWGGLAVGGLYAVSPYVLGYARMISSEMLALTLVVAVACLLVTFTPGKVWPLAGVLVLLAFTRLEFVPLPALLLVMLLASRPGRRTALNAICATGLIYAFVGGYVLANSITNDYTGMSVISPINRLGKIMQYRLEDEAPERYAAISKAIDEYLGPDRGRPYLGNEKSPWYFGEVRPEVRVDNWSLAGEYANATIRMAPGEFAWETARRVGRHGWFVVIALGWLVGWVWTRHPTARVFGLLSLLGVYDLLLTELGGYEFMNRLQAPTFPIRLVVLMGTVVLGAIASFQLVRARAEPGHDSHGNTAGRPA